MLAVVREDFLAVVSGLPIPVISSQDGVEDLLSSLLAIIDTKTNLHVFVRLKVAMGQLLKEVKDNVLIIILILVHKLSHLCFGLLSSLDQFEELIELNVHVIVNSCHHFFDLLTSVDKPKCDQRVF